MSAPHPIAGARVLLLEDNFVIALELGDHLRALGAVVDGPHATVSAAREAGQGQLPKVALLDVHVRDGSSVELAAELRQRGVAVVFVTGYSTIQGLPSELGNAPQLQKPVTAELIDATLRACV